LSGKFKVNAALSSGANRRAARYENALFRLAKAANILDRAFEGHAAVMKILIPDDYQDVIHKLDAFSLLAGHEVVRYREPARDLDELVARLHPAECVVEIRERIDFSRALIERLPNLRLIALVGSRSR
jgi:hypothetical protein